MISKGSLLGLSCRDIDSDTLGLFMGNCLVVSRESVLGIRNGDFVGDKQGLMDIFCCVISKEMLLGLQDRDFNDDMLELFGGDLMGHFKGDFAEGARL